MGQHFLINARAARRIVERFAPSADAIVLEIGPGRGVLTGLLLDAGAAVVAVERDPELHAHLRRRFAGHASLDLVCADILRCDLAELSRGRTLRVLANLPYAITGAILLRLFRAASLFSDLTLMVQKEVADRLVADPGHTTYASISVLAQYFTRPRITMRLSPGSFSPPPAVSSSVVAMPFRASRELTARQEDSYPAFVGKLFAHRRRTLRNNLRAILPGESLETLDIDPARRPQTLDRGEVLRLFQAQETAAAATSRRPPPTPTN